MSTSFSKTITPPGCILLSKENAPKLHANWPTILDLYRTIEPSLPPQFKSLPGMCTFFATVSDIMHDIAWIAEDPATLESKEARANWLPIHARALDLLELSNIVSLAAIKGQKGEGFSCRFSHYNQDDFPPDFMRKMMPKNIQETSEKLRDFCAYLATKNVSLDAEKLCERLRVGDDEKKRAACHLIVEDIRDNGAEKMRGILQTVANFLLYKEDMVVSEPHKIRVL